MKKLFFLIFLTACSNINYEKNNNSNELNFNENLTFIEFENLLLKYVNESSYPNIND